MVDLPEPDGPANQDLFPLVDGQVNLSLRSAQTEPYTGRKILQFDDCFSFSLPFPLLRAQIGWLPAIRSRHLNLMTRIRFDIPFFF